MSYAVIGPVATAALDAWATENGHKAELGNCINKHLAGDWGLCSDPEMNDQGLETGGQLLSVWEIDNRKFWIISDPPCDEGERVVTCLFPEDY